MCGIDPFTLFAATIAHVICIAIFGGLPRILGAAFVVAYGVFLMKGF